MLCFHKVTKKGAEKQTEKGAGRPKTVTGRYFGFRSSAEVQLILESQEDKSAFINAAILFYHEKKEALSKYPIHIVNNFPVCFVNLHSIELNVYCCHVRTNLMTKRMTYHLDRNIQFSRYRSPCMPTPVR